MNSTIAVPTLTSFDQADTIVQRLADRKNAWVQIGLSERIVYLNRCIESVTTMAEAWADAACWAKGIAPTSTLAGEEWLVGPCVVLWNLQRLIKTLKAGGQPTPPKLTNRNGQIIATVFPDNLMDRLMWLGFRGEVWMEPGKPATQGWSIEKAYRGEGCAGVGSRKCFVDRPNGCPLQAFCRG